MNVYSIRDNTAEYFGAPFIARNQGEAVRSFTGAVNDTRNPDNLMAKHPSEYALYLVGTWDETTGRIIAADAVTFVGSGTDYLNQ